MKTKTSLRGLTLISLTSLLLLVLYHAGGVAAESSAVSSGVAVATIGESIRPNELTSSNAAPASSSVTVQPVTVPACPPPTVKAGSQCVLTADAVLDHTLVLLSDTTLNCQGHRLTPRLPTPITSPPQVGIFLNRIENVRIQQCVIDGFDFGVFALNSKHPIEGAVTIHFKSFEMSGNTVNARYTGVSLMAVDEAEIINGNTISYTRAGGRALYIGRFSNLNKVLNNTFAANLVAGADARAFRVPGPKSAANPEVTTPGAVVVIAQLEGPEPTLLNIIIDKQLFQISTTDSLEPNSFFSAGNRFEGNTIRFPTGPVVNPNLATTVPREVLVDGIALAVPQSTLVLNNRIQGNGDVAIRVGTQHGVDKVFPGQCHKDLNVRCLDDAGCNIGFGTSISDTATRDTCTPRTVRTVSWISRDTLIEGNIVRGTFAGGIHTAGQATTIKGNTIDGGSSAASVGIRLIGKNGIETSTVLRNSVSNFGVALNFIKTIQCLEASEFGAKISLNDFTGYKTAVLATRTVPKPAEPPPAPLYNLPSELSVDGRGNFWGIPFCPAFDPTKVKNSEVKNGQNNSLNPLVTDSHPYTVPVSRTSTGLLPNPCLLVPGP